MKTFVKWLITVITIIIALVCIFIGWIGFSWYTGTGGLGETIGAIVVSAIILGICWKD